VTSLDGEARRLHVALVHEGWPPTEVYGGIVRYVVCLAHGLRERGHDVTVVASGAAASTQYTDNGIRVVRVPRTLGEAPKPVKALLYNLAMSLRYALALAQVQRIHPIDVVEFSNWGAEGFVHSVRRARPQVTRVSTMGWQTREFGSHLQRSRFARVTDGWRDWIEAFPLRRSDLLLAPSSEHAQIIAARLKLDTLAEPTPHGTEGAIERSLAPSERGPSARDLLYVGKLEPRKGFDTLVEAFARAHRDLPGGTRLRVAGSDTAFGPRGSSFRDYVLQSLPLEVCAKIDILGWVDDDELGHLYRRSAVVVAPSRYESFGLPFIEAMQYGKAVIGTTAGGIPDVVEDGVEGILVPPGDVDVLAAAMTRVLTDDRLRERFECASRARYERDFTKAAFASRAENAYRRVIAQRTRTAGTPA
jgi:glycogen(starch) synthase